MAAPVQSAIITAQERYSSLPWPTATDEEWRRTDPSLIPVPSSGLEPPASPGLKVGWETPPSSALPPGVILTDLMTAAEQHPQLIEQYLYKSGTPEGLKKFVALHQALATQGLFCYVPDGVRVEFPLKSWMELTQSGGAVFPHVLLFAGRESELTLIDERYSAGDGETPVLSDEMVEIFLKKGANLRYVHLQRWNPAVTELFTQRAVLEQDAQFLNITIGLGGCLTKATVETVLQESGARSELLGILLGSNRQHFDFHTLQDHRAERTFSDLLYKSALADQAESIYTGLIRITKQAQKSDAYQANRNLLLSEGAKADSIPMLEIETNDVRCTHGVAVGPVDEDQLFYLMSRGLPHAEAERLIVEGFFDQVFKRIPMESLREELAVEVNRRLIRHG